MVDVNGAEGTRGEAVFIRQHSHHVRSEEEREDGLIMHRCADAQMHSHIIGVRLLCCRRSHRNMQNL